MICNSKSKNRNVLFIKQKELLNDTYYFEYNNDELLTILVYLKKWLQNHDVTFILN